MFDNSGKKVDFPATKGAIFVLEENKQLLSTSCKGKRQVREVVIYVGGIPRISDDDVKDECTSTKPHAEY
ncbi:MAG: hypothetical protein CXT69_03585 [Methanobacteriota archaeon]|jgi:hypothetical protein|nr:MAG: hypothetical protein CXT69_03585 [Euryarchaeota archaeon]